MFPAVVSKSVKMSFLLGDRVACRFDMQVEHLLIKLEWPQNVR